MLPKGALVAFHEMLTLTSAEKSYANYRQRLQTLSPPCVPYLGPSKRKLPARVSTPALTRASHRSRLATMYAGMYLTDLAFIDSGNKDTTDGNLINFAKRRRVADVIQQVQLYQTHVYHLARVDAIAVRRAHLGSAAAGAPDRSRKAVASNIVVGVPRDRPERARRRGAVSKIAGARGQTGRHPAPF